MSGTDFTRLNDIKDKIMNNEIDVILMKDSSRLGRNQLESLKFIELINEYNVEIIFENEEYNEDFFGLKVWFNELRTKDDSKKIRRNLRQKLESGKLIIRSHYGYKVENNIAIVDHEVDHIVQKIFDLYIEGYGYRAIANKLNEEFILTPSQYRQNNNVKVATSWIGQHVSRILHNEFYTGTYIAGTTKKVSFESKKTKRVPKDQWIRIENHHEAIISKEQFQAAQNMIQKKKVYAPRTKKPSLLAGFVFCGRCGSAMYMKRSKTKSDAFVCGKYFKEGRYNEEIDKGCFTHSLKEEDIDNIIKNI